MHGGTMEKRGGIGKREARLEFKLQLVQFLSLFISREQAEA
jgi:hypothetical protein